jgi:hypothetical protein
MDNFFNFCAPANVSGIDTQTIRTVVGSSNGQAVIEMDIGNQRDIDLGFDGFYGAGGFLIRHRHPHNLATGGFQPVDLSHSSRHILGRGIGHGLDGNWSPAADRYPAQMNLVRVMAFDFPSHQLKLY